MKLDFKVAGLSLVPVGEDAHDYLKKQQEGQAYVIDLVRNRNPGFHRRSFKMMKIMHEMSDVDIAFDPWRKWLLIQTGYHRTTGFPDGSVLVEADSMAYEKMNQEKFEVVWRDIHQKFCEIYGDQMTYDQLNEWSFM